MLHSHIKVDLVRRLLLLCILFLTVGFAEVMPMDKRLVSGVLPNGLRYMIMHNEKPAKMAEFRLMVKAGSLDEEDGQRGLAHFTEHMAFNGTKHFKKNALVSYLESIGLRFGGDLNANTNYERTLYKLSVPVNISNVDKAFLILHDWADGLVFDPKEFDKERGVVLEEKRLRNTPYYRMLLQFLPLIYGKSKYTQRDVIGKEEVLRYAPVQRAIDFYQKWYRPERMALVVVGDVSPKAIESKIRQTFSDLKNKNHASPASRLIPDNNTTRVANVTDQELGSNSVDIYHLQRQSGAVTTQERKAQIIDWMVRLMFNYNAGRHLLDPQTKLLGLSMREDWISSLRKASVFHADFTAKEKETAFVELNRIIYYYANFGFDALAFKTAREQLLATNENNHKERDSIFSVPIASGIVNTLLSGAVFVDEAYGYAMSKKLLGEITLHEVNRRYREIVANKDRVIVFMGSGGKNISKEESEKLIVEAKKSAKVKAKNSKRIVTLSPRPSKCAKITEKKFDKEHGIYYYTLENNVTVDFKPTDLKKNEVLLSAVSPGGYSIAPLEDLDDLYKSARWVVASIPGEMKNDEMEAYLAGKELSYDFAVGRFYETISGGSSSADLETLMHLIYLQIVEPKLDVNVARQLRNRLRSQLVERERDPGYRFEKAFSKFYYKNNPRILFDNNESIEKLDTQKMLMLFKKKFSDMNHFHFIIVGDTTAEKVEELISCYLGNLPVSERTEHYNPTPKPYRKGLQQIVRAFNSSNIANITLKYRTKIPYSMHNAAVFNALQSILTIRLRKQIREEKSGTYGIGVSCNQIRELQDTVVCNIDFAADPKRGDELVEAVQKSIGAFVKEGPTQQEVTEMKKEFEVVFAQMKQQNGYWLSMLQLSEKFGTPLEAYLGIEREVDSVSAEEIRETAKKIFEGDLIISERKPKKEKL